MREDWSKANHTVSYEVKVEGAPDIKQGKEVYVPFQLSVKFQWWEGEPINEFYAVHVYRRRKDGKVDSYMPGKLFCYDPIAKNLSWVNSIIQRAYPRRQGD